MDEPLYSVVNRVFQDVCASEEGRDLLRQYDMVVQLDVVDGEPMFVEVQNGVAKVAMGRTSEKDIYRIWTLKAREQDLKDIFLRRIRLIDAMWEGKVNTGMDTRKNWWVSEIIKVGNGVRELF